MPLNDLLGSTRRTVEHDLSPSRPPFSADRKELYRRASQDVGPPVFKRTIPPPRQALGPNAAMAISAKPGLKDNPAMSFVMLTNSQLVSPQVTHNSNGKHTVGHTSQQISSDSRSSFDSSRQSPSYRAESTARLFEVLSSRSDIDHPVCAECTELLLTSLQARLKSSIKERDAYVSFLKNLNRSIPSASDVSKAEVDLAKTEQRKAKAFSELLDLEKEKENMDNEIADLEAQKRAVDRDEESFWRSRNAFALKLADFHHVRDSMNTRFDHDSRMLERLQRTNVYNDTFCIGHDGFFGTINNLRLGRLAPPHNVEWPEINAAWGMTALLLSTVAERLGFTFRGYRIQAVGSTSCIEKLEYPSSKSSNLAARSTSITSPHPASPQPKITSLDLFSSGDIMIGRQLLHRHFNDAMVAFLECLKQLGNYVNSLESSKANSTGLQSSALKLPYEIQNDKIGDASIKLGASQDEVWTRACKYTLTCCKFLLAYASNIGGSRRNVP